jgi:hypothetical protein
LDRRKLKDDVAVFVGGYSFDGHVVVNAFAGDNDEDGVETRSFVETTKAKIGLDSAGERTLMTYEPTVPSPLASNVFHSRLWQNPHMGCSTESTPHC